MNKFYSAILLGVVAAAFFFGALLVNPALVDTRFLSMLSLVLSFFSIKDFIKGAKQIYEQQRQMMIMSQHMHDNSGDTALDIEFDAVYEAQDKEVSNANFSWFMSAKPEEKEKFKIRDKQKEDNVIDIASLNSRM